MSDEVFSRVPSVFFVCGGSNPAGGCTLQYVLDNGGFANFDKSLIMDGAGGPIAETSSAPYNNTTGVITESIEGEPDDAEVGMIVYAEDDGGGFDNPGRYEITAIGAGTITIESGLHSGDTHANIYVGGSFDTLPNALDNITADDAGGKHDCYLFTNLNEEIHAQPTVSGGGNLAYNTKLFITGFNTTLLDMRPGGTYYQSAYDAYKNGIDSDCHVKLDLDGAWNFNYSSDCIITQNLRISVSANYPINLTAGVEGLIFNNCIIDDGAYLVLANGSVEMLCFVNCYLFDTSNFAIRFATSGVSFYAIGCVIDMGATAGAIFSMVSTDTKLTVTGCILKGGNRVWAGSGEVCEWNNTIIAHDSATLDIYRMNNAAALQVGFNDIIVLPQAVEVVSIGSSGGCVLWKDFFCLYGSDDAEYTGTYGVNDKSGGYVSIRDFNTIDIDPDFDSSYRPKNPQVLRGGPAMLSDGRSQLGAIKQKYQFPQKGRAVNHGRLGILR